MALLGNLPLVGLSLILRNFATFHSQISRAEALERRLEDTQNKLATRSQRQARMLGVFGGTLMAIGGALSTAIVPAVRIRQEFVRVRDSARATAEATGSSADEFRKAAEDLKSYHITGTAAYNVLTRLAMAQLELSKASRIARVALDLSARHAGTASEIFEQLTKGITTQTTTVLKQYGATASAEEVFKWYAGQVGKTTEKLSELEEVTAIYLYTLAIGKGVQGAFADSMSTAAVKADLLKTRLQVLAETGHSLDEAYGDLLDVGHRILTWFTSLPKETQKNIFRMAALAMAVAGVAGSISFLLPGLKILFTAVKYLPGILFGGGGLIKGLLGGGKATAAFAIHMKSLAAATSLFTKAAPVLGVGKAAGMFGMVLKYRGFLPGLIKLVGVGLVGAFAKLAIAVGVLGLIGAAVLILTTNFGGLRDLAGKVFADLGDSVRKAYRETVPWLIALQRFASEFFERFDRMVRKKTRKLSKDNFGFEFDPEKFFMGGLSIVYGFVDGIITGLIWGAGKIADVLVRIADMFIGTSPPPTGPLADIDMGGYRTIEAWIGGMLSVSLDPIEKLVDKVSLQLRRALWEVRDAAFGIAVRELELDKLLYPIQDNLFLLRAQADLASIPLERNRRILQRQLDHLEDIHDIERDRLRELIASLTLQRDLIRDLLQDDRDKLDLIEHELFMENLRNKILRRAVSARELELRSQAEVQRDQVAARGEELDAAKEQIKAEKERLDQIEKNFAAQERVIEQQIKALDKIIQIHEDRVRWQEEELDLAKARQAIDRLRIQQEERFWKEQRLYLDYYNEVVQRAKTQLKELQKLTEDVDIMPDFVDRPLPLYFTFEKFTIDEDKIAAIQKKMKEKFFDPLQEKFDELIDSVEEMTLAWTLASGAVTGFLQKIGLLPTAGDEALSAWDRFYNRVKKGQETWGKLALYFFESIGEWAAELLLIKIPFYVTKAIGFLLKTFLFPLAKLFPKGKIGDLAREMGEFIGMTEADFGKMLIDAIGEPFRGVIERGKERQRRLDRLLGREEGEIERRLREIREEGERTSSSSAFVGGRRSSYEGVGLPQGAAPQTITNVGPTLQLTAHYAQAQSAAAIRHDVQMLLALA